MQCGFAAARLRDPWDNLPDFRMTTNSPPAGNLQLPNRLARLLESGHWPRTQTEALRQNLKSLVPKERIQLFAPEESTVFLRSPPFHTVADHITGWKRRFGVDRFGPPIQRWRAYPELSILIGDFGLGSDSPTVLDYRQSGSAPSVTRLRWRKPEPNVWICCAETFDEFADMLGLDHPPI